MAGGTDNNQLKSAAKTRWQWQQQFVDNDEDNNDNDNDKHDERNDDDEEDNEQDDEDNEHDKHDDDEHDNDDHDDDDNVDDDDDDNDDDEADTATAVGGDDSSGNSDGRGHRQQSTKIGSKDTAAVATAIR